MLDKILCFLGIHLWGSEYREPDYYNLRRVCERCGLVQEHYTSYDSCGWVGIGFVPVERKNE